MIAAPTLLANYYNHSKSNPAVFIGSRRFAATLANELPEAKLDYVQALQRCTSRRDIRDDFYAKTDYLRNSAEPYWAFSTCNLTFPRTLALSVGLFDENIVTWGLEDNEFGYRLWQTGVPFIHLPTAIAIHLEHDRDYTAEKLSWKRNRDYFARKHGDLFENPFDHFANPRLFRD